MKTAIVLAFERLPLRLLGCYGGETATPAFDRLAVDSIVFDSHLAENVDPTAASHTWWTGQRQMPASRNQETITLPRLLTDAGIEVTAAAEPPSSPALACPLPGCMSVDSSSGSQKLLQHAQTVLSTAESDARSHRLFWWQSAGLSLPDVELAARFAHPVAQVRALDAELSCFEETVQSFPRSADAEILFILTAAQGVDLGEHNNLPEAFQLPETLRPLSDATVHSPLLVSVSGVSGSRRRELVQTVDLLPTIADWFGVPITESAFAGKSLLPLLRDDSDPETPAREFVCYRHGDEAFGIRTEDFALLAADTALAEEAEPGDDERRLFVKPDDVWDVHNVAGQEPEIVAALLGELREFVNPHD